jgi:uncharacterized protein (TIGR02147 family)
MPVVHSYTDYRLFLRDYLAEQKKLNTRYSQRLFAKRAGLSSMGFLSEVLSGKRHLSPNAILRFAKVMKLKGQDLAFFECLVAFNQAKSMEERNHHFSRLAVMKGGKVDLVGTERYEFYRHWYHSALRECIACRPVRAKNKDDFSALGQSLSPSISGAQAKRSVDLLLRLGFVIRDARGFLKQATPLISTGSISTTSPSTLDVDNFQMAMLGLARRALDKVPRTARDFSTLTLSLSADGVVAAQAEIAALRKRLLVMAENDAHADRVFQFNFQSFPLSKV